VTVDVRIVRAGAERLREVEPLARALHAHHVTVDPAIPGIPPRDEDGWWRVRRSRYEGWLAADPDAFVLLAEDARGDAVGYALVTFRRQDDSHATGDRFAELESLAVLPEHRGRGIGTALLHRVYRELRSMGVEEMAIGVLATNEPALRMYEREGFRPWVLLTLGKVPDLSEDRAGRSASAGPPPGP
jgi:ribosomal protein S18 acetylase RimI-like enzyme